MIHESQSDADDGDDENTEAQDDRSQQQYDDHTIDDDGTPATESADAAVAFCEVLCVLCNRVTQALRWHRVAINAFVSRALTYKCTTKDEAALFAARLSTCCCICTDY